MLRITSKWWLGMAGLGLPKLHVAYLTGFAKISGLYISYLKIKIYLYPNVISKLTTM